MRSIIILLTLFQFIKAQSIICTNNSPKQYFNFPKLAKCNLTYKNNTKIKRYEVFKSITIEFISNAYLCKKIVTEFSMYTDLSGYEHLIKKEINKELFIKECEEMRKNKFCEFGNLKKGEHSYHTNNKVTNEYPNRFTSLFKSKQYLKENCILIETKVFSNYNKKYPTNVLAEMNK